jgi:hypothetical protein
VNDQAWTVFLDRLPLDLRDAAQVIMQRITTLLEKERLACLADVQRVERRQSRSAERIDDLQLRLDRYEQDRLDEARVEIERLAADMLPKDERDKLIQVLYRLAADVEQLKARAVGDNDASNETRSHGPE